MNIQGKLMMVGQMAADEVPQMIDVPSLQVCMSDGRIVTITGLTVDEVRAAAPHWGDQVALNLSAVAA